ncbi:MAG: hypothetical protein P8Z75_10785 [Gammaproteobacteria bacterium]|jgi:hypothetical protein
MRHLQYDVVMTRPLTMYFISIWLAIWLIGIPLRNQDILVAQFGPQLTMLFLIVITVAALVIGFQLLQCHPTYVELALAILAIQLGYLLTRFIWLALHAGFQVYPLPSLIVLGVDLYCVTYLMTPSTRARISRARAIILAKKSRPVAEKHD